MLTNNNIIIVEPSQIISEGLAGILTKNSIRQQVFTTHTLEGMELLYTKTKCSIVILNPSLIQSNAKAFNAIKSQFKDVRFVGLIYAYFEESLLAKFDAQIRISDSSEAIYSKISKLLSNDNKENNTTQDVLSDREIDVLKLLASGLANKEIADKLNISIHTVITHRKNITQKTGIKSVSGLTIYAVVQKIISTNDISL